MISQIIKLIQADEWLGVSDEVDIAKGIDEHTNEFKKVKKQIKRKWRKKQSP